MSRGKVVLTLLGAALWIAVGVALVLDAFNCIRAFC
jgi:hypothetical protein